MCSYAKSYGITIHNYCLMNNHYHLLIEIQQENLSKFMRQLGMNYAIYFNKKYKRSGHLWQGRYKSWFVTDEAYLYTLMLYIEQNPLKAKMVQKLEHYPFGSYYCFINPKEIPPCLKNSWIVQHYQDNVEQMKAFLNSKVDTSQLQEIKKVSSLVEAPNIVKTQIELEEEVKKLLANTNDKKKRNLRIQKAYKQGYSQHTIAKVLGITQQAVFGITKRGKK
ncbi:MAG: transposase [Campylobacterota bacterium]|nr:transposase [Campylobacterota bacterium]